MSTINVKTEDDYYDGPPPPEEIPSNKPKLPHNRISPEKVQNTTVVAITNPKMSTATLDSRSNAQPLDTTQTSLVASSSTQSDMITSSQRRGDKSFFVSIIIRKKIRRPKKEILPLR